MYGYIIITSAMNGTILNQVTVSMETTNPSLRQQRLYIYHYIPAIINTSSSFNTAESMKKVNIFNVTNITCTTKRSIKI